MQSNNNINTGLAQKIDAFRWSQSTDNKPHVIGVKTSAPDFSIPPTPASSYANIHVVLDNIHPSTVVTTSSVLSEPTRFVTPTISNLGVNNRSFSSLPREDVLPLNNRLDDVPSRSFRAVPDRVDPEQPSWKSNWSTVGSQLLKRRPSKLNRMEEAERQWRMSRPVDALWSGRIHEVGMELTTYNSALVDLTQWADKLKVDLAKQTAEIIRNVNNIKPEIRKMQLAELELEKNLNRRRLAETRALEEKERAYRINRGVDAVFSGKWHQVGLEVSSLAGVSWSEWFTNLKNKTVLTTRQAVKELKKVEMPSMPEMSMPSISMPEITLPSMPAMPAMPAVNLPDLKLGVVRSEATLPMIDDAELVDFTFKKNRLSYDLISMMEEERQYRLRKGVNPVLYGLWFRLGQELKYKFSLRPTFEGVATKLASKATDLVSKAGDMLESIVVSAEDTIASVQDAMTPAPVVDFAEHKHLNLFAFTAEKIDFTFKKNRTPASIIALEEAERRDRMSRGYDRARYAKWNAFLLAGLPKTPETMIEKVEKVAEVAVETVKASGWGNYLGSLAHNVADATTHFVEVAKESLHMAEHSLPSSVALAEEAERVRRMNNKVDPMTAARMGRVQDELLNFSIKSKN